MSVMSGEAGQDCHYDCILGRGAGEAARGPVRDCLFSTLLEYLTLLTWDILHIYKSHVHASPSLHTNH